MLGLNIHLGFSAYLPRNLHSAIEALPATPPAIEALRLTFYGTLPDEDSVHGYVGLLPLFDDTCTYRRGLLRLWRVHCRGWPNQLINHRTLSDFSACL
jgi:hypothetical protein